MVHKLRPKFNKYVATFGAKSKWVKLSEEEKKSMTKYKNRKNAVYFCNLTLNKNVKHKLLEQQPEVFAQESLLAEISLYKYLSSVGIPEIVALGWIVAIPKKKIEKIPKIANLSQFLDQQVKKPTIFIEKTPQYKQNPPKIKKVAKNTRIKRKKSTLNQKKISKKHKKRKRETGKKILNLCSSDDEEWNANYGSKKRRKLG